MNKEPIVSIITPCYNGEKHVSRLLDSLLTQTYSNIEFIFVNDGSTDNTERIVLSYKDKLENKGIKLVYIYQENKGLGGSINTGLKKVTGKYFCWPDSDDFLEPESVELRLQILERFPEFAVVTSDAYIRSIENLEVSLGLVSASFNSNYDTNQFLHLLNGKSIFCPGTHMVRSSVFFETHPTGEIYPSRRGQNYQILLPIYFGNKRYFLDKPLYNYIRHNASMSQYEAIGFDEKVSTYSNQRDIIMGTLNSMNLTAIEKTNYISIVDSRFSKIICSIAYKYGNFKLLSEEYNKLKTLNQVSLKLRLRFYFARIKCILKSFEASQKKGYDNE